MDKATIYKRMYGRLIKIAVFLFLATLCFIFFLAVKKVKKPPLAFGFMDYSRDLKVESVIFDCLDASFIPKEIPAVWLQDLPPEAAGDFIYFKYAPKYSSLLNTKTLLPVEMHLFRADQEVPFVERDLANKPNLFWSFISDKKNKIYTIDAAKMTVSPEDEGISGRVENGLMLWKKGNIRQSIEFSEGSKQFVISAANSSNFESDNEHDPHMAVYMDDAMIGDVFVRQKDLASYIFDGYTESGWHKFVVEFDNAFFDKDAGKDSNLLIKDIQIYDILGVVYLGIRKGLEERLVALDYGLSYFRTQAREDKNQLIRFFKNRFHIDSLRDVAMEGPKVGVLINEVEISGLIRKAIFAPAPTRFKLKLKVPEGGIKLLFGFGVMEEAWDKTGDGVEFRVKLDNKASDPEEVLFSRYINPKSNEKDRRWFSGEADLVRFKGQELGLVFETRGSIPSAINPNMDDSYDWAVWSE